MNQLDLFRGPPVAKSGRADLGQWNTPEWAAEVLVRNYFPELNANHRVIEPGCGPGAFLKALPDAVQAIGIEIDPSIAAIARENTNRTIITGDFRVIDLPFQPTHIIGNPSFEKALVDEYLEKAFQVLPKDGRVGFILPTHHFQYAKSLLNWHRQWSIRQDAIPREIFPRISLPISFVTFEKSTRRTLVGFFLYDEVWSIRGLKKHIKLALRHGSPRKSVWAALVEDAIEQLGGEAGLNDIYAWCGDKRPTDNQFWKEKIRQTCQDRMERVKRGTYRKKAA